MMQDYLRLSAAHPFLLAFVQFGLLGTLGEVLAVRVKTGAGMKILSLRTGLKAVGWAFLGIYIKIMFLTASGGVQAIAHYTGEVQSALALAFGTSVLMNLMLGPSMMILHRLSDQAIDRLLGLPVPGWQGLAQSLTTLIWLWIPLHTFTFTQAPEARVGIAAVLSLLLGIVMGWFQRRASA